MGNDANSQHQIKALQKAFKIVESIDRLGSATLAEISRDVELPKTTVYRHLATLKESGYIAQTQDEYQLSYRFLEYGIRRRSRDPVYAVAKESMNTLAEDTGERVWCVVKEGPHCVYVYKVEGKYPISTDIHIGQRRELHPYAAGKAILAFQPQEHIDAILDNADLIPRTENTITDRDTLLDELETIRERGYAVNREESIKGLRGVGAPIRNEYDEVHASLSIAGAANRMLGDRLTQEIPEMLLGAVNDIELGLRHP
ncbi:IclR family transcriptional regulator [Natrarchaeobius chitinivorans]|uniref:IclR family transcriptional regulator n=1 Tax=Natrarchaeobius chitinivorans TaxID=1679083 RepID=A0A3N6MM06_NATCH|nr:IclR family transcriptional regulator [Natrarchaeobius chitinivorans]RQG95446.1 IclR family transcriptional regulator [Natrarchaeobius chitinivorans]